MRPQRSPNSGPVSLPEADTSSPHLLESARPPWSQPYSSMAGTTRRSSSGLSLPAVNDLRGSYMDRLKQLYERSVTTFTRMTLLQKVGVILGTIASFAVGVGFMVFTGKLFEWLETVAEDWEKSAPAYIIIWLLTVVVSFPPLIGWSTIGTVAGFVFGVWKGWLIFATASVIGSTCSFFACRTILSGYVHRLMERDKRFTALALTLKYDGLKLLCMIRLCPLPYSICNGAISTFPTVHPLMYGLATAIVSPKFLISTFVGSRLRVLSGDDEEMSAGSKALNIISLIVSICVGIFTGVYIYRRTLTRSKQLEEEERAALRRASQTGATGLPPPHVFSDEPDVTSPLRRDEEERIGFQDDAVELNVEDDNIAFDTRRYQDEFTDNESDVFEDGDGASVRESYSLHRRVDSQ